MAPKAVIPRGRLGRASSARATVTKWPSRSAAYACTLCVLIELKKFCFHLRKQTRRNEAVSEILWSAGNRGEAGIRPLVNIVLGHDHPALCVIEPQCGTDCGWDLNARGALVRSRVRDRQSRRTGVRPRLRRLGRPIAVFHIWPLWALFCRSPVRYVIAGHTSLTYNA